MRKTAFTLLGALLFTVVLPASASHAVTGCAGPDAKIKTAGHRWVGNDDCGSDPAFFTQVRRIVSTGVVAKFRVKVQNDSHSTGTYLVSGSEIGATGHFDVAYCQVQPHAPCLDVTPQIEAGTYSIDELAPGATSPDIVVRVVATPGTPPGTLHKVDIVVYEPHPVCDCEPIDGVRAKTGVV